MQATMVMPRNSLWPGACEPSPHPTPKSAETRKTGSRAGVSIQEMPGRRAEATAPLLGWALPSLSATGHPLPSRPRNSLSSQASLPLVSSTHQDCNSHPTLQGLTICERHKDCILPTCSQQAGMWGGAKTRALIRPFYIHSVFATHHQILGKILHSSGLGISYI